MLSCINFLFAEYVDTLIGLNRTDILLASQRFRNAVHKSAHVPLSSRESFKSLSTEEKKVRKAKQFGVQLMPGLGKVAPQPLKHRVYSSKDSLHMYAYCTYISPSTKLLSPTPPHSANFVNEECLWYIEDLARLWVLMSVTYSNILWCVHV